MNSLNKNAGASWMLYARSNLGALALALAVSFLTACSTLEVEVDVYKGALVNTKEIQLRQYVSLANSAKPLMTHVAEAAQKEYKICMESPFLKKINEKISEFQSSPDLSIPNSYALKMAIEEAENYCSVQKFQRDFLCETRNLYEKKYSPHNFCKDNSLISWEKKEDLEKSGIDILTQELIQKLSERPESNNMKYSATDDTTGRDLKVITNDFNHAMIFFAQRLLFYSNNRVLFKDLNKSFNDELKSSTPILQTLGNTILVHANDLQRQENREDLFDRRTAFEKNAILGAFQVPPSLVFDRIVLALSDTTTINSLISQNAVDDSEHNKIITSELQNAERTEHEYQQTIASLLAAHLTLIGEFENSQMMAGRLPSDLAAAKSDRESIALLIVQDGPDNAISKITAWLDHNINSKIQVSPQRLQRLTFTKTYFEQEKESLNAVLKKTKNKNIFSEINQYISSTSSIAITQLEEYQRNTISKKTDLNVSNNKIRKFNERREAAEAEEKINSTHRSASVQTVTAVKKVREGVVKLAEASGINDAAGVHNLLKIKIQEEIEKPAQTQKKELMTALDAVQRLPVQSTLCAGHAAIPENLSERKEKHCGGENPIEVIDNLIASLRAQRIQALSVGNTIRAIYFLDAINAAYEQRTSLIYLRPASDYLRSVYTATAFQDSPEREHRNMLVNWREYLPSLAKENDSPREQLEKLHWQNINKVSVRGGGNTNYVLAKDDVGNWYVKAYSADPESIIKSATSLALFNSGKLINTNLLRRAELRRQIDDPKTTPEQAKELQARINDSETRDPAPLLKIKERHAARYQEETAVQANSLLSDLTGLPARLTTEIDIAAKPTSACTNTVSKQAVGDLDRMLLEPARTSLRESLQAGATVTGQEKAMQAGLQAMHRYGSELRLSLATKVPNCDEPSARIATAIPPLISKMLSNALANRKRSIERYEDGLIDLAAVADAK